MNKALLLLASLLPFVSLADGFSSKIDVSARFDARHEKSPRYQYRVRWYPQYQFNATQWSVNAFAVTGDAFASSYNTFNAKTNQHIHLRRLFLRHENQQGKTEIGVLPTYKGRVSSSGLSKDGWISGIRHVSAMSNDFKVELVVGELAHTHSPSLNAPKSLNYVEAELSAQLTPNWHYELGIEHLFEANFARGEIRFSPKNAGSNYALELINNFDTDHLKLVLSTSQSWLLWQRQVDVFAYYSYVNQDFGQRAELTEDFVDFGHAFTVEVESALFTKYGIDWFSKIEFNEGQSRLQLGVKFKL